MRTVILAGGFGSRLSEETVSKPKPMVAIGPEPILWHIMKHYAHYGFTDFVVALGYRGEVVKQYFAQYATLTGDLTIDLSTGTVERADTSPSAGRSTCSTPVWPWRPAGGCGESPTCSATPS